MPQGTLKIFATTGSGTAPVAGASYAIKNKRGEVLFNGITNENGESLVYTLDAPAREGTLQPDPYGPRPYGVYDIWIAKSGFAALNFIDVEVLEGVLSVQPAEMIPVGAGEDEEFTFVIPPPTVAEPTLPQEQVGTEEILGAIGTEQLAEGVGLREGAPVTVQEAMTAAERARANMEGRLLPAGTAVPVAARPMEPLIIPDFITVHLGRPTASAQSVRVRFIDYVKNVTCSEIYPTWPVNAIIANVHCIVTFALNRVYSEWYRVRGFNFDITNSTTVDQKFIQGRTIFQNISQIVDGIFNVYARRAGFRNPFFTQYCNGTTATCSGLSQWGTVPLANRGFTPIQILHNFYPRDLELVSGPSGAVRESYPGTVQERGSTGEPVRTIQSRLNRIRVNYPAIPVINPVDGVFGASTDAAVRIFQRTFNLTQDGRVGRTTWNRISQIWAAVTRLSELNSEGERIGLSPTPPSNVVRQGARGADVVHIQFLLDFISQFHPTVTAPLMDSVFGAATANSVRQFQQRFGLNVDGVVGPNTWRRMYEVFRTSQGQLPAPPPTPPPITPPPPPPPGGNNFPPYPGVLLRRGATGANVRALQQMLNWSRRLYRSVPEVTVDGIFGPRTENSVRVFQTFAGLTADGVVGPITWNALRAIR